MKSLQNKYFFERLRIFLLLNRLTMYLTKPFVILGPQCSLISYSFSLSFFFIRASFVSLSQMKLATGIHNQKLGIYDVFLPMLMYITEKVEPVEFQVVLHCSNQDMKLHCRYSSTNSCFCHKFVILESMRNLVILIRKKQITCLQPYGSDNICISLLKDIL